MIFDIRAAFFFCRQATSSWDNFDIKVAFRQIQASNSIIPLLRTQDVVQLQLSMSLSTRLSSDYIMGGGSSCSNSFFYKSASEL